MKLIVPIYSMRSYETGEYSILKDGNFKLHINRMDWDNDILVVPENTSDLMEFVDLGIIPISSIVFADYGVNAYETRKTFWSKNLDSLDGIGLPIVTDITGYDGNQPFFNNFNITKDPNSRRPYIDDFIETDIDSIRRAQGTTVLNQGQKDYLVSLAPDLEDKIEVNQKVISKKYFDKVGVEVPITPRFDIFFPFRISDKAYQFDDVVNLYSDSRILITDPNDSYESGKYENVWKQKLSKREYYGLLSTKPEIVYMENPNKVFHPGLADFIYFGCNIVSPHRIPTLEEVLIT